MRLRQARTNATTRAGGVSKDRTLSEWRGLAAKGEPPDDSPSDEGTEDAPAEERDRGREGDKGQGDEGAVGRDREADDEEEDPDGDAGGKGTDEQDGPLAGLVTSEGSKRRPTRERGRPRNNGDAPSKE